MFYMQLNCRVGIIFTGTVCFGMARAFFGLFFRLLIGWDQMKATVDILILSFGVSAGSISCKSKRSKIKNQIGWPWRLHNRYCFLKAWFIILEWMDQVNFFIASFVCNLAFSHTKIFIKNWVRWDRCWWQVDVDDFMLVTIFGCWLQNFDIGHLFRVTSFRCWFRTLMLKDRGC